MKPASKIIIRTREGRRNVLAIGLEEQAIRHDVALAYAVELEEDRAEIEGLLAQMAKTARRETAHELARWQGEGRQSVNV